MHHDGLAEEAAGRDARKKARSAAIWGICPSSISRHPDIGVHEVVVIPEETDIGAILAMSTAIPTESRNPVEVLLVVAAEGATINPVAGIGRRVTGPLLPEVRLLRKALAYPHPESPCTCIQFCSRVVGTAKSSERSVRDGA